MKPFDLEKALSGAPVITRDGREVTQLHLFDVTEKDFPLYGVIHGKDGDSHLECFTEGGKWQEHRNNDADLFMKTEKKVWYVHPSTIKDTPLGDGWIKVEYEE